MVAVAQARVDARENPAGLLAVFVGDTVEGGSDGGVGICAGRQGQAKDAAST